MALLLPNYFAILKMIEFTSLGTSSEVETLL